MLFVISNNANSQRVQSTPIINPDNSVSFFLDAPNATEIMLKGSFVPRKSYIKTESGAVTKDGSVKMTREGNRWTYTTTPLPSEFYTYTFEVDGKPQIDKNNKNVIRDIADSLNYFVIGNGIADNYVVKNLPHGTVKKVWYPSSLEGMNQRRMTVYLPSSYTTNKNKRFPVLYLAKGFDPVTIKEQLTIAVLSIDSFAATDKESRHVRRENSELAEFGQDSLMEVLAALNPVVIIDESHNFRSNLRTETLRDINPSFILELTATPRETSNVNSETFDKIKDNLVEMGIPAEQIKIKTAGKDELKGIDLMSRDCPVRYIITVNALKEGWDCPFAYILASLANRTSKVDVEQILGRILRLPYTKESDCEFLNMGYVLTSSNDFEQTITGIIDGLQNSGFSAKDYRAVEPEQTNVAPSYSPTKQPSLFDTPEEKAEEVNDSEFAPADIVDVEAAKEVVNKNSDEKKQPETVAEILSAASQQNKDFTQKMEDEANEDQLTTIPVKSKASNEARIKTHFEDIASPVILPIFEIRQKLTNKVLFDDTTDEYVWVKLEKEHLYRSFDISKQDKNIQWNWAASTAVRIDLEQRNENEFVPKSWLLNARQMDAFKSYIATLAPEGKIGQLSAKIATSLPGLDCITQPMLVQYIKDVIGNLDSEKLSQLTDNLGSTIELFREKIRRMLSAYAATQFDKLRDMGEIRTREAHRLPKVINLSPIDRHSISKSLYTEEGSFNDFEAEVIRQVSALGNAEF